MTDLTGRSAGTINGIIFGWTEEDPPRLYVLGELVQMQFLFPIPSPSRGELLTVNGESAFVMPYTPEIDQHIRHLIDQLIHLREDHPHLVQMELSLTSQDLEAIGRL